MYNTQTGKTRAVNINDRVVSTPTECACYVMQQLNIAGRRVLAFYDSGANSNIVEWHEMLVSTRLGSKRSLLTSPEEVRFAAPTGSSQQSLDLT